VASIFSAEEIMFKELLQLPKEREDGTGGLIISPLFTESINDVFSTATWEITSVTTGSGKVIKDVEFPTFWSENARIQVAEKYFRRADVPQFPEGIYDRHAAEAAGIDWKNLPTGPETSLKRVINRLAGTLTYWGVVHKYFRVQEDAISFYKELAYMMLHQYGALNSPQWFNTGMHWAYGISSDAKGQWYYDFEQGKAVLSKDGFEHPQAHACFILGVKDDLFGQNGIFDTAQREAKIFYFGSGSGSNYSTLRGKGEPVSGGGVSSGMMSFLDVFDVGGGVIKSGGKTRRAAKMDICSDTHPEFREFVQWKMRQEKMVRILIQAGMSGGFEDEAYRTVRGMNSNNTVSLSHAFFDAVRTDSNWNLRWVTDPSHISATIPARDLWDEVVYATWFSADPGIHATDTINEWNTCQEDGRIVSSNPCVTGDTFVATADGYRRIKDIVGTRQNIINGNGDIVPVSKIFKTGTKDVYRIRTKSGYSVRVTGDHKVWTTNRGDVPASELLPTDSVQLRGAGFGSVSLSEDAATVLGAVVGDGCVTQGTMVITSGKDERPVSERFARSLNALKSEEDARYGYSIRESHVNEAATALRVSTSAVGVIEYLSQYAVMDEGSDRKRFTDAFFATDHLTQRATLRALYTADGTVANYGNKSQYVSLDSTSIELLRQVQLILLNFGIKSKLYENRRSEGMTSAMLPDGRGGTKEYDVKQMHSLRVSRSSRVTFEREIGFLPESKKSAVLEHVNKSFGTYGDNMEDRIFSITPDGTEDVYDLTEPISNHFVANGMVVHNCSEYLFLNETACNLASLNLVRFFDLEQTSGKEAFNREAYRHAIRVWQLALDITVSMAQYPAQDICEKSMQYRTTGLGYTNLGGLLMLMGYGYASKEAQQIAGALTAILGGESYVMSAMIAKEMGAYPAFERNRANHLRVIRNHRQAAHGKIDPLLKLVGYEGVTKKPQELNMYLCPQEYWLLLDDAETCWSNALTLGELYGYRNAQATVLAPTGTISFAMDADTFGIEPDYALIKYKALAGGGYAVIVNRLIEPALKRLKYTESQIAEIIEHVNKTGMVEDAPHLLRRHYSVFDTAVAARPGGRSLAARAHIEMMAACQPFLCGAISKTINLPEEATEDDISDAYLYGYDLGLKAIAVYRANSKAASVMFTNAADMQQRQNIDLGSHSFDIKNIFMSAANHWGWLKMHALEDLSEQPMVQEEMISVKSNWSESGHSAHDEEMAEAIEMPTYGCKDGVCSI
jgi:ribonucleoside-diphosphate reductase alpha chain